MAVSQPQHLRNKLPPDRIDQHLKIAQRAGRIGTFEWNVKNGDFFWSPELEELYGLENGRVEFSTFIWSSLIHPEDRQEVMEVFTEDIRENSEIEVEFRIIWPDKSIHWILAKAKVFYDKKGQPEKMIGINSDITTQKHVQEELRRSQERYRAFVEHSNEGIWRFELEKPVSIFLSADDQIEHFYRYGYLAECNDATAKMYGYESATQIVGARLSDFLVQTDPDNIEYLRAFIGSGYRLTNAESHEKDVEGNDRYFQNNLVGILEDNCLIRAWGMQNDITERKRVDRQKDEFLSIASHELKTPVTSIKAFVQLLSRQIDQQAEPKISKYLKTLNTQVDRLANLVQDLLDVSRLQTGKLEYNITEIDLDELIEEIVDEVQPLTKHHQIIIQNKAQVGIKADKYRLGQVLTNVLTNAIRYSPSADRIIVKPLFKDDIVTVGVQDFGIGIPEVKQQFLFTRFYRVQDDKRDSFPGLGLGLYIAQEIITRLGGKMWVESQEGQGSTFYFSLPAIKFKNKVSGESK